jgi:hypothetical protein
MLLEISLKWLLKFVLSRLRRRIRLRVDRTVLLHGQAQRAQPFADCAFRTGLLKALRDLHSQVDTAPVNDPVDFWIGAGDHLVALLGCLCRRQFCRAPGGTSKAKPEIPVSL